jgi:hypothetical protein
MKVFIIGVIVGVIISTVGFTGIFKMLDNSVESVKVHSKQLSK